MMSLNLPLACLLGEDFSFASLAGCAAQILAVKGGACFSGNLPPSGENLSLLPSGCLCRYPEVARGACCSGLSDLAKFFLCFSINSPGV